MARDDLRRNMVNLTAVVLTPKTLATRRQMAQIANAVSHLLRNVISRAVTTNLRISNYRLIQSALT